MHRWSVAIIGGGPGGLMTAYLLQKQCHVPLAATIFEAGNRLGGKIRTNHFAAAPVADEAGAAELYDYSLVGDDPLWELIAELGLATKPMGGATVILGDRLLATTLVLLRRWIDQNGSRTGTGWFLPFLRRFSAFSLTVYVLHHAAHLWPLWIYGVGRGEEPTCYWRLAMDTPTALVLAVRVNPVRTPLAKRSSCFSPPG